MNLEADSTKEFFEAVNNNDVPKVEQLLSSASVDVDSRNHNHYDRTALHIAAHNNYYDLVVILVDKYQAQVNIEDNEGKIPLQLATDRYYMNIVKFLLKRNSNLRDYASHHLNSENVEELFEAAHANDSEKIIQLINQGVDVNAEDLTDFHRSILEVAATRGHYNLVQLLVDSHNADIYHEDDSGESAYHKAVNNNHDNISNFLLERGFVNPYGSDQSGSASDVSLNLMPS